MRAPREETWLHIAAELARRATCGRRAVGCVLVDAQNNWLADGYNGPAHGELHCTEKPCAGRALPSGTGLDKCEAIHAEQNALLRCRDVTLIETAYITTAPCLHCVKLLRNTACRRIVFLEPYASEHLAAAKEYWLRDPRRYWTHWPLSQLQDLSTGEALCPHGRALDVPCFACAAASTASSTYCPHGLPWEKTCAQCDEATA